MIGTVTFDGLSQGRAWARRRRTLNDAAPPRSASRSRRRTKVTATLGLLVGVALVAGFYWLGSRARSVWRRASAPARLRRGFVHSLVPIALVYVAAHYLTFLLFEGQAIGYLASDPLGRGLGPVRDRVGAPSTTA